MAGVYPSRCYAEPEVPYSFRCSGCGEQLTDDAWDSSARTCIYCSGTHAKGLEEAKRARLAREAKAKAKTPEAEAKEAESRCPRCGALTWARPTPGDYRESALVRVCVDCGPLT